VEMVPVRQKVIGSASRRRANGQLCGTFKAIANDYFEPRNSRVACHGHQLPLGCSLERTSVGRWCRSPYG